MSQNQRDKFTNINSVKQYQPKFPLVYDPIYGPYSAITEKDESLSQNFVNLLLTSPGEWPMNPELGIGLKKYLFEQSNMNILQSLKANITKQLSKYLPHIKLHSLEKVNNPEDLDNNTMTIKINYIIRNNTNANITAYVDKLANVKVTYKKVKQFVKNKNRLVPNLGTDLISKETIF